MRQQRKLTEIPKTRPHRRALDILSALTGRSLLETNSDFSRFCLSPQTQRAEPTVPSSGKEKFFIRNQPLSLQTGKNLRGSRLGAGWTRPQTLVEAHFPVKLFSPKLLPSPPPQRRNRRKVNIPSLLLWWSIVGLASIHWCALSPWRRNETVPLSPWRRNRSILSLLLGWSGECHTLVRQASH